MLTPDDESGEGRLRQSDCRGRRRGLWQFFKESIDSDQRDIRRLRPIMQGLGVEFMAFRDDSWFTHEQRAEYFDAVPTEYLAQSVVFIDPDIGLETRSPSYMLRHGPEKYLLYSELESISRRSSTGSVVVVYQHLQKDARKRVLDVERVVSRQVVEIRSRPS